MPKQQTDFLMELIRSLTTAEKRHFRVYVNRNQATDQILFLQLFDVLDKLGMYDEEVIFKRIAGIKKRQLSNIKAHLYKQLLVALRLYHRPHNPDMDLRERIDYARLLYNKGLYRQSLDILEKAKERALQLDQHLIALECLDYEKMIESQYITRSHSNRSELLTRESLDLTEITTRSNALSNLSLRLYSLYLRVGFVKNAKEELFVQDFFERNLPALLFEELTFFERMYLYQSYIWYNFMTQNFLYYYKYAQKWVDLFDAEERAALRLNPSYIKGLHNLLNSLFYIRYYERFTEVLQKFEDFVEQNRKQMDNNLQSLSFLFLSIHRINRHYMEGTFQEGLKWVRPILKVLQKRHHNYDPHREMVLYYRIACLYFGSGENEKAIEYLNLVIDQRQLALREDIQCFARILCLIAHFELENEFLIEYQVRSVYRFLIKMKDLHGVQREILRFLRQLPRIQPDELRREFIRLKNNLKKLQEDKYERRPFLYLDIISWLECKIDERPIQDVIRDKFVQGKNLLRAG